MDLSRINKDDISDLLREMLEEMDVRITELEDQVFIMASKIKKLEKQK